MNIEWLWTIGAGAVVTMAGFWCTRVLSSIDKANETLAQLLLRFENIDGRVRAQHERLDKVEGFIDKVAERRMKA